MAESIDSQDWMRAGTDLEGIKDTGKEVLQNLTRKLLPKFIGGWEGRLITLICGR